MIDPHTTIRQAMQAIDRGAVEIALVVDSDLRLLGTVSDGDVRRALLGGATLDDGVQAHACTRPAVVGPDSSRAEVLDLMRARALGQVPVVDERGCLLGLHVIQEVLGRLARPNCAVIMAGGRGQRLAPLTDDIPKPMVPVAGRPILERIVLHLVGWGITRIFIAVNYRADVIESHFGDGSDFSCKIDYLREEPDRPLGTGGALGLLADRWPQLEHPLLVMNGDLVTQFAVGNMLDAHAASGAAATLAAKEYTHQVPFGVIEREGPRLVRIAEKPLTSWWINAGIYVIEPFVIDRVPRDEPCDMPALLKRCIEEGDSVQIWMVADEWQDVGRPEELQRARGLAP